MDYAKLVKELTKEMKAGVQYKRIPAPYNVFIIVAMIPFILSFLLSKFSYLITLYFYKALSAPTSYLHQWLKNQKDEVHPATQAVMYFVCLPFIFSLQVLLSLSAVVFFFQWFIIMVLAYIVTLGGIKWQPFVSDATFEDDGVEYELKPDAMNAAVFACIVLGSALLAGLLFVLAILIGKGFFLVGSLMATFFLLVYSVAICIVNPCIFKRVPKARKF